MICQPCCEGKPADCKGKTQHPTYCDNQHKGKGEIASGK